MDSHIVQPMGLGGAGQSEGREATSLPGSTVPGHRLLGNYRILRLLGQGGFADVYLGEHIHLHTQAAIKVLQVRLVESNIQSFLNEARTIAHLVHPYIIRVLDFGVEANTPFLVMDYAPRGTFRQRFLQGKPLPPTPLFPAIKQAASALQYAHDKKLIHRDVKPENMLLGPNDEVLLSDFGFALIQTSLSRPSPETAGTASYMAPEQFQGKPQPASDQYSLAVVAYEWLTGTCPFQGTFMELASQHMLTQPPSLLERVPGLSPQIAQVIMTALAKEPDQRFPTVGDFARALERACLASNPNFASGLYVSPPPFLAGAEAGPPPTVANPGSMLSQDKQKPQPILQAEYQSSKRSVPRIHSAQYPSPSYSSQQPALSELPPLPQRPFLSPELAQQSRSASLVSQRSPAQPNTSIRVRSQSLNVPVPHESSLLSANSVSQRELAVSHGQQSPLSAADQASASRSTPLVRAEDFWTKPKPTTSRPLYFFVIFMLALIIASTAILSMLKNSQTSVATNQQQATPGTNATVPATSQQITQTPAATTANQTEQNPYGNHNGTLVLDSPLHQQDPQLLWDELPSKCSFSTGGYHVVAGPPQRFTLCSATASDYANFVYQVQMTFTKVTSTTGSGGLVLRGNKTNTQFYFLEIFTTGNYAFYRCPGTKGVCATLSAGGGPIPSFNIDLNKPNTIALMVSDNAFSIFVNSQLVVGPIVDVLPDLTYSHGRIGMMARQNNLSAVTDVSFNGIKIWQL